MSEIAGICIIPLPAAYLTLNVVSKLVANIFNEDPNHSLAIVGRKKCQLIPVQILLTRENIQFAVDSDLNIFAGKAFEIFHRFLELPEIYTLKRPQLKINDDFVALLDKIGNYPLNKQTKESVSLWLSNQRVDSLSDAVYLFRYYQGILNRKYYDPVRISVDLDRLLSSRSVVKFLQLSSEIFNGFDKDFVKSRDDIFYSDPPFSHLADLAVNYKDDFKTFLFDINKAISYVKSGENNENKIELMTALRAKGREFDTVIVLDVNDGIWPNKKAIQDKKHEEERRLFYVTITRAKKNLLLFESNRINGEHFSVSPYIREMKLPQESLLSMPNTEMISKELSSQLRL